MKQYATQNTEVKVGTSKVEVFAKKALSFARRSYEEFPRILLKTYRFMYNLCSSLIRSLVRLSIILIALIMLYTFIESHPVEWANCINFFKGIWADFQNIWNNMFSFLR